MVKIPESCSPVNARTLLASTLLEAEASLQRTIALRLAELLLAIVHHVLGRAYHRRRAAVSKRLRREGRCCRCGSTKSHRFSRNGFRTRRLLTRWGELSVDVPRVRCECGGSVRLDLGGVLRPYQRVWDDVDAQIERWGALALSLRQMRHELAHLHIGPLALRTLNQRLHQLAQLTPDSTPSATPPILQVDAVWITLLRPNGQTRRDHKRRQRAVKGRFKCPLFIAMGVWPDSNHSEILLWRLGHSEDAEEWTAFLSQLEAQGLRGENGLRLIIHDGGSGLCAALRTVYFGAHEQRCLFHKLRNIYDAIRLPDTLSPQQRRRRRRAIFKDFRAIWQARHYATTLRRYLKVVRAYRHSQPLAVATLRRDFRLTVTYFNLEQKFPTWDRKHLRTISRLERFNRNIRRQARAANAYHSELGVIAMATREAHLFHASQPHS
jgi:transposase-like protein